MKPISMVDLKQRGRDVSLRIIRLYGALPKRVEAWVIGKQLVRCGTSVGAHYREGIRSRSDAEFVSKLEGGLQELEETSYWLELFIESGIMPEDRLADLIEEANQLTAILVTCVKRAKNSSE